MQITPIEWADFSANPLKYRDEQGRVVWGCVHASPGCVNCYSEALAKRYGRGGPFNVPTQSKLTPFLDEKELRKMLTARRVDDTDVSGSRCFVGDMTDIFGDWVSDELLDRLFAVFALRRDVTWQVLTKRAERMRGYMASRAKSADHWKAAARDLGYALEWNGLSLVPFPLPNVWLGVSVENQKYADERIPLLLKTPAAVRFISAEPLLGAVDLNGLPDTKGDPSWDASALHGVRECAFGATVQRESIERLHWVIVGGESGHGARPFDVSWAYSLIDQCKAAGVPAFVKQLGSVAMGPDYRWSLRNRKGGDPSEWPPALRVREFPEGRQ